MGSNDLTDKGEQEGEAPEVNYGSSEKGGIQEDDSRGGPPESGHASEPGKAGVEQNDNEDGQSGSTQPGGRAHISPGNEE